ncbi:MAG TPA: DUF4870 domain-containing protein [Candidatus Acidoferrum sp.]|nr:DUF4870 domain-containing protein [Candidatus Acidoferrum sp.]
MSEEGVVASAGAELSQDEKAYAGLAHALMISTWWIGPLIIYLIRRESRFVSFHALQALFWQIILTVLHFTGMIVFFVAVFSTLLSVPPGQTPQAPQFPAGFLIAFPLLWLTYMSGFVISMTLGIIYCLKAMRGQWAGYPLIGRWARRIVKV